MLWVTKASKAAASAAAAAAAGLGAAAYRRGDRAADLPGDVAARHAAPDVGGVDAHASSAKAWIEGASQGAAAVAEQLRSVREAAAAAARAAPGERRRPPAAAAADFFAALHDGAPVSAALHPPAWLLGAALESGGAARDPDWASFQRLLLLELRDPARAARLLGRPAALAHLLRLAPGSPPLLDELREALPPALAGGAVCDLAAEDAAALVDAIRGGGDDLPAAYGLLALHAARDLAAASLLNCSRLAAAGVGPALADAAGRAPDRDAQLEVAAAMRALAARAGAAARGALALPGWAYRLLCCAADAAAGGDWALARAALEALAACLDAGAGLPGDAARRSALPLLTALAAGGGASGSRGRVPVAPEAVRPAVAAVVRALAEPGGGGPGGLFFSEDEGDAWAQTLLGWLGRPGAAPGGEDGAALRRECATALAALAAPPGPRGLHVAHAWAAELIVTLSLLAAEAQQAARRAARAGAPAWVVPWGYRPAPPVWWPRVAAYLPSWGGGEAGAAAEVPTEGQLAAADLASRGDSAQGGDAEPEKVSGAAGDAAGLWWWQRGAWGLWWSGSATGPAAPPTPAFSDSELSMYVTTAPVGPAYARSVAYELLRALGRGGDASPEPPAEAGEPLSPAALVSAARGGAAGAAAAGAAGLEAAGAAAAAALKVLTSLASGSGAARRWLLEAGALPLLQRLVVGPAAGEGDALGAAEACPLGVRRQAARLLAMLSAEGAGPDEVAAGGWVPWLQDAATAADCKLASSAARALLHIEAAAAAARAAAAADAAAAASTPLLAVAGAPAPPPLLPEPPRDDGGASDPLASAALLARRALDGAGSRLLGALRAAAAAPPLAAEDRVRLLDGVHLFDPLAAHHVALAREGAGAPGRAAPAMDVVFVHGIRGGPFATWRVYEEEEGRAAGDDRARCWPAAWLPAALPHSRLLSAEYAAPATGWEGESLPLAALAAALGERLAAAGVGRRPVVFVAHSMGGVVVKELLARAAEPGAPPALAALGASAAGAVFYSVPHAGSRLADVGWALRLLGAAPAAHVRQLRTSEAALGALNAALRARARGGFAVLSFGEGRPTRLAALGGAAATVVPHESTFPGCGEFVVLADRDHVGVCKPRGAGDPAYARAAAFLAERERAARGAAAARHAEAEDHMEAAL